MFGFFSRIGCCYCSISCGATIGGLSLGVALSNIIARAANDAVWYFPSVASYLAVSGFCSACIKSCTV